MCCSVISGQLFSAFALLSCSTVHVAALFLYWFIEQINDDDDDDIIFHINSLPGPDNKTPALAQYSRPGPFIIRQQKQD